MEYPLPHATGPGNGGFVGKNPFDDDVDDPELCDLLPGGGGGGGRGEGRRVPSPVQQLEQRCIEMDVLLSSQTTDPFAMEELREHLSNIERFLIKDRPESHGQTGPCLQFLLNENVVENIYMFSTRQKAYAKEIRVMLLKFFTEVFTRSPQPVLIHQQILRPISKLLRACEGTNDPELNASLVPLLHTICILMQENQSLLDLFFFESRVHMQSRFLIFSQLIPHMHMGGEVGNRARDALLLCLSLADQLPSSNLTHFIASDSNFCQVLATGLSGLYCGLPSTRDLVVDDWQSPLPVIEKAVPELMTFIQALDFCNSVLQMAPKLVCNTMLALVREGFLQQVMGAALLQKSESAVMFSLAYMTIFLKHITNVALMREFLCYLMQGCYDDRPVLSTLIQNISSTNPLMCAVTLEFFYVLLDLNCEDVMLELVFKHLLPGLHVMPNQLAIIGSPDLYAQAARKLLQLLPASCVAAERLLMESIRKSQTPPPTSEVGQRESSPPPPVLTSSLLTGKHLERPSPVHPSPFGATPSPKLPLTNIPMLPPVQTAPPSSAMAPPTVNTNPFDAPVPASHHTPISRSRSGSDASSSSLVSISSTPHVIPPSELSKTKPESTSAPSVTSSSTASTASFHLEHTSPEMAYYHNLMISREGIKECTSRCQCWSSIYDKCQVSKETLLQRQEERRSLTAGTKSLEMEDISSIKIRVTEEEEEGRSSPASGCSHDGDAGESEENGPHPRSFRSRATTVSAKPRLTRTLRNHDKLHSHRTNTASEENETKMVAGASTERAQTTSRALAIHDASSAGHQALRRSGTISGSSSGRRGPGSPRFSPQLERRVRSPQSGQGQFEDKVGLFLKILMDKLMEMMQHPPTVNILLTRLIVRLAYYPQPLLRSLLLNHQLVLKPGVPNLLTVLQYLKQTVDRYARTQEGFEKRLGRARKTMLYRAQVRNSQVKDSVARQIVKRQLLQQNSRTDLLDNLTSVTPQGSSAALMKTNSRSQLLAGSSGKDESGTGSKTGNSGGAGSRTAESKGQPQHRSSVKKRNKKVSTDTLFAVMILYEFLQELASISEEQSVMHSLLYLPKSTSLLVQ